MAGEKKELQKVERSGELTPARLIEIAIQKDSDITKLEKLMELQERWEAKEAKKAYYEALTAFRAECPDITKTRNVNFETQKGKTSYNFAGLAETESQIRPILKKHGLAITWRTKQVDAQVSVTCKLTHISGHEEETTLCSPPDTSGGKNSIQAMGSTISYLERYTLFAILGLSSMEMDTDGNIPADLCDPDTLEAIKLLVGATDANEKEFFKYLKCEGYDSITAKQGEKALIALRKKHQEQADETKKKLKEQA